MNEIKYAINQKFIIKIRRKMNAQIHEHCLVG
jgi:hypothetical protein